MDENGQAMCKTDLPFGSFYLKELSTDSHYLPSGETFPFTFEYGGPSVAVVEINANDGEAISNELIRGEIRGMKTDENGTGLSGAVIGLFQSDETEFTAKNALGHRNLCGGRGLFFFRCAFWKLGIKRAGKPGRVHPLR